MTDLALPVRGPVARRAGRAGPRAAARRPPHRPFGHAPPHQPVRARRHARRRHRRVDVGQSPVHQADPGAPRLHRRHRRGHLQGHAARRGRAAGVPRLPLRGDRRPPRPVPPRPLRRAHGRGAHGRRLRPGHVPRHRGPHLRGHRRGHQPPGPDAPGAPAASRPCRSAAPLRLDDHHRPRRRPAAVPGPGRPPRRLPAALLCPGRAARRPALRRRVDRLRGAARPRPRHGAVLVGHPRRPHGRGLPPGPPAVTRVPAPRARPLQRAEAAAIGIRQLTGIAGLATKRLARLLDGDAGPGRHRRGARRAPPVPPPLLRRPAPGAMATTPSRSRSGLPRARRGRRPHLAGAAAGRRRPGAGVRRHLPRAAGPRWSRTEAGAGPAGPPGSCGSTPTASPAPSPTRSPSPSSPPGPSSSSSAGAPPGDAEVGSVAVCAHPLALLDPARRAARRVHHAGLGMPRRGDHAHRDRRLAAHRRGPPARQRHPHHRPRRRLPAPRSHRRAGRRPPPRVALRHGRRHPGGARGPRRRPPPPVRGRGGADHLQPRRSAQRPTGDLRRGHPGLGALLHERRRAARGGRGVGVVAAAT